MIRAIDTAYAGYKFRSRLEARWAVFFDSMGIKWEYELEGYILGKSSYLPDFYLPTVQMYGEVKPAELKAKERAVAKALARESGQPVLMLVGVPELKGYSAYQPDTWAQKEIIIMDYYLISKFLPGRFPGGNFITSIDQFGEDYLNAVEAAKSARFEHGYTPSRV